MSKLKLLFTGLFLLCVFSCSSSKILGSWKFIEVYDGEIRHIDHLKMKNGHSKYGSGILTFHQNGTFSSMEDTGNYQQKKAMLMMKYKEGTDTAQMKISYLSHEYLFLYSTTKAPKTWVYKKVESQKK